MTNTEEWDNEAREIALLRELEDKIHADVREKRKVVNVDFNACQILQSAIRQKRIHMAYLGSLISRETAREMKG